MKLCIYSQMLTAAVFLVFTTLCDAAKIHGSVQEVPVGRAL